LQIGFWNHAETLLMLIISRFFIAYFFGFFLVISLLKKKSFKILQENSLQNFDTQHCNLHNNIHFLVQELFQKVPSNNIIFYVPCGWDLAGESLKRNILYQYPSTKPFT